MKKITLILAGSALIAAASHATAQTFTAGDLIVSTYGDLTDSALPDGAATPITLEEYSLPTATSATLALTDELPTTGTGGNVGIVGEYGSSSEGTLQLSGNDEYLTIGGYDGNAAAGTSWGTGSNPALAQSTDTAVPRIAATIDANGNVNTSTVLNDVYNTNNPRSVYSANGTSFYISGQGAGVGDEGGIYTVAAGTNTTQGGAAPTPIFNVVSTRTVTEYNGNLYYSADQNSSKKGTQTGLFEYTGTPTSTENTNTGTQLFGATALDHGSDKTVNLSPQGFVFANSTTLYVADTGVPKDGGSGDGGIQKWSLISGTWTLDYTLTPSNFVSSSASSGETGFEALTLSLSGNNVDIYAVSYTAGDANPNGLYAVVDSLSSNTGTGETFTELEQAPGLTGSGADYNFKGVSFAPAAAPEPSSTALLGLGLLGVLAFAWKRKNALKA